MYILINGSKDNGIDGGQRAWKNQTKVFEE